MTTGIDKAIEACCDEQKPKWVPLDRSEQAEENHKGDESHD